jgi:hypothetical protein
MRKDGGNPVSIIPFVSAARLLPVALVAGKAATEALGSFAELLKDAVDSAPKNSAPVSQLSPQSTLAKLPANVSTLLRDFASSFNQLLRNHELDADSGVLLQLSDTGNVEVAGDHSQGPAIQNLLAKAPQLLEQFRDIAAQATAHRKTQEFAAFQANPQSTGDEFPLLFSKQNAPKFQLHLQGDSATASFV